ncbi:MAG: hypothetical protein ACJ8LG_20515 [Massilia sp.]
MFSNLAPHVFLLASGAANMSGTKRSQNRCKKCNYTWYPRGKSLSLKCPSCGGTEVGFAGRGIGLIALVIVGIALFGGEKHPGSVPPEKAESVSAALGVAAPVSDTELAPQHAKAVPSTLNAQVEGGEPTPFADPSSTVDASEEKQAKCAHNTGTDCGESACGDDEHGKAAKCDKPDAVQNTLY